MTPAAIHRLLAYLAIAVLPIASTLLLTRSTFNGGLHGALPLYSDETLYWREIDAFRAVGFNTGYFSFGEETALPGFTRYGAHGFLHAMLLGTAARVTGWTYASMPLYNAVLLIGAFVAALIVIRPRPLQCIVIAVLAASWWPILIYLPMTMMEIVNHALALVFAALIVPLLRGRASGRATDRLAALTMALTLPAGMLRLTWAFLVIPVLLLWAWDHPRRRQPLIWLIALGAGGGLLTVHIGIYLTTVAPFPATYFAAWRAVMAVDMGAGIAMLADRLVSLGSAWFIGFPIEVLLRGLFTALLAVALVSAAWAVAPLRRRPPPPVDLRTAVFLALTLVPLLAIVLTLYDVGDWRSFRVLSPYVLLGILLLIGQRRTALAALMVAANLIGLNWIGETFSMLHLGRWSADNAALVRAAEAELAPLVMHDADAASGWCSTVLIEDYRLPQIALPAGVGIVYHYPVAVPPPPIRSRYVLAYTPEWSAGLNAELTPLASTPGGTLYVNTSADC